MDSNSSQRTLEESLARINKMIRETQVLIDSSKAMLAREEMK